MHARSVIRAVLASALSNRSEVVRDRVYVQRDAVLNSVNDLPCVVVFSRDDTTDEAGKSMGYGRFRQSLSMEIQVYHRRSPDQVQPKVVNYSAMAEELDAICGDVEQIAFQTLYGRTIERESKQVHITSMSGFSTSMEASDEGALPHCMASIKFNLAYDTDLAGPLETCPFDLFYADVMRVPCDPADPLAGTVAIKAEAIL
jgi:hypothetical protein